MLLRVRNFGAWIKESGHTDIDPGGVPHFSMGDVGVGEQLI